jgi:ketosteroid isomerase-like protein
MISTTARLSCALALAGGLAGVPAIAAAADDGPVTVVKTFLDAFNKGDIAGAQAANAASEVIIDEVPPHAWGGQGAFQAWASDLGKDAAAKGQTDEKVTLDAIVRDQIDGDTAYVVAKVTFTYKLHGTPTIEHALLVSSLAKQGGVWKVNGWAWAGEVPKPAR